MRTDLKRVKTFLAYKGFQWEPLPAEEAEPVDFHGCRRGHPRFRGAVVVLGEARPSGDLPDRIVIDDLENASLRSRLSSRLSRCARGMHGTEAALPKAVFIVNHEPCLGFEDLAAVIDTCPNSALSSIHLFLWFDDFRSDRILFNRSERKIYQTLDRWFGHD